MAAASRRGAVTQAAGAPPSGPVVPFTAVVPPVPNLGRLDLVTQDSASRINSAPTPRGTCVFMRRAIPGRRWYNLDTALARPGFLIAPQSGRPAPQELSAAG